MPGKQLIVAYALAGLMLLAALSQYLQVREMRAALINSAQQQREMQSHVQQLESNLRSAGLQMQQLSDLVQEANQRAVDCQLP